MARFPGTRRHTCRRFAKLTRPGCRATSEEPIHDRVRLKARETVRTRCEHRRSASVPSPRQAGPVSELAAQESVRYFRSTVLLDTGSFQASRVRNPVALQHALPPKRAAFIHTMQDQQNQPLNTCIIMFHSSASSLQYPRNHHQS